MKKGIWIAAIAVATAGCGNKSSGNTKCAFVSVGAGATAQYHTDVACPTNPFPSDEMRTGGTVSIPAERIAYVMPDNSQFQTARQYMTSTISKLDTDGFSTLAPILIPLSHEVDPATASTGIRLFTLTTGATPALTPDTIHTFTAAWDPVFQALVLQPDIPLEEQTEYGIAVTADLKDLGNQPTIRAPDFETYLKGSPRPEIAALVAGAGVPADQVALAFTFRTRTIAHDLVAIRDQIFGATTLGSSLVPQYNQPTDPDLVGLVEGYFPRGTPGFGTNIADAALSTSDVMAIGGVATAAFDVYKFRDSKIEPFNPTYVDGDGSASPTEHIQMRLALPTGTPPPGGYPVILFQHGLGGSSVDVYEIAERANEVLTNPGYAVIGTEAVAHGRRGGVFDIFDWDSMANTRDNFRESVADDLMLLRAMRNAHDLGIAPFDQLNVSDVSYLGISLGGILGGTFTALSPNVPDSALVVPGGHIALELTAPGVGQAYLWNFVASRAAIDPGTDVSDFLLFIRGFEIAVQTGLDPADPANFGIHVKTPGRQLGVEAKNVLIQESHGDTWVPNVENEALRRAIEVPIFTQGTNDVAGLSAAWVYTTADFPSLSGEPHSWWGKLCNERVQTFDWIDSHAQSLVDPTGVTCTN